MGITRGPGVSLFKIQAAFGLQRIKIPQENIILRQGPFLAHPPKELARTFRVFLRYLCFYQSGTGKQNELCAGKLVKFISQGQVLESVVGQGFVIGVHIRRAIVWLDLADWETVLEYNDLVLFRQYLQGRLVHEGFVSRMLHPNIVIVVWIIVPTVGG